MTRRGDPRSENMMDEGTVLETGDQYRIVLAHDTQTLSLEWKNVKEISIQDFSDGIVRFSGLCGIHEAAKAVIDARNLDPESAAIGWVSGRDAPEGQEPYTTWWSREIVPMYHSAGIAGLAVVTGDPAAPGEVDSPPEVTFRMGYFHDLDAALDWPLSSGA